MFSKALFVLTAVALAVNAQSSSLSASTPSSSSLVPDDCVLGCVEPAAANNGCGSYTNVTCVCTNGQFQVDAGACLAQHCPNDVANATALQNEVCAAQNLTVTNTATPTPNPVSFTSITAAPSNAGGGVTISDLSTTGGFTITTGNFTTPSASKAADVSLQSGAGAFFGAILAALFAI